MLMNTWQSHLLNWQEVRLVWVISGSFFTQDYFSEHSYSHTSLILLIAYVFPVTCILLSVCLCG